MSVISAILLGFLQGLTEYLPVSSFGHLNAAEHAMGLSHEAGVLFEIMLHIGTLAALFLIYQNDIKKIFIESLGMGMDLIGNLHLFLHNKLTGEDLHYTKVIKGTYRKVAAMLFVTSIPTALIGFTSRRLVEIAHQTNMFAGIGLLLTGVFLIVVDYSAAGGHKTQKDARFDSALWIGICQGLSVFPGLSRCGLTIGSGLFCGFQRKFAVKYSFLASIPAILGSFLVKLPALSTAEISASEGALFFLGMFTAAVTGYVVIRITLKMSQSLKLRYFALYCFAAGVLALAINLA